MLGKIMALEKNVLEIALLFVVASMPELSLLHLYFPLLACHLCPYVKFGGPRTSTYYVVYVTEVSIRDFLVYVRIQI